MRLANKVSACLMSCRARRSKFVHSRNSRGRNSFLDPFSVTGFDGMDWVQGALPQRCTWPWGDIKETGELGEVEPEVEFRRP